MIFRIMFVLLCAIALQNADAVESLADQPPISYVIDFSEHNLNYLTINAEITTDSDSVELMMPVWTPGSYLVREFTRHIDSFKVADADGNELAWEKIKKNRWKIETGDTEIITVSYRIYCNELTVRTNHVDGEFAVINGAPTFLTVAQFRNLPHSVKLDLPERWKRSATSLAAAAEQHHYVAESYDELVDSPIVAGNISVYPFTAGGIGHQLVNVGGSGTWDGAAAASDLKKMVEAHHALWQTIPYNRYLFLNIICGRGGGLEHDNSTVMMTGTWNYRIKSRYKDWLSLASHEFFHTWNVRRLRPKALANYDYENEVYTPSLWIAEGITSYYEDVLLARSGLIDKAEYLKRLNSNISAVQNRGGRLKQSLRESSFDTWIKFYRPSPNSSDTQISYYAKGAVVGFLLDAQIRRATDDQKSLDDVMVAMFERYLETGYTEDEFRQVVNEVSGSDLGEFFATSVDSAVELDYTAAGEWYGLKFPHDDEPNPAGDDEDNPDDETTEAKTADTEPAAEKTPWLGFELNSERIRDIQPKSPAESCGLNNGDELLAIQGYRITGGLSERLKQYSVGDSLELLIARRQKLMTKNITVGIEPESKTWKLTEVKEPTFEQTGRMNRWLGIEEEPQQ